jgi:hypothetical protein
MATFLCPLNIEVNKKIKKLIKPRKLKKKKLKNPNLEKKTD